MTVLRRNSLVLSSRVCIGHAIAEQLIVEPNGSVDERLQASSFRPDRGSHGGCARTSARVPRRTGGRSAPHSTSNVVGTTGSTTRYPTATVRA